MARDYQTRGFVGGAVASTLSGSIGTGDTTMAFTTGGGTGYPTTNWQAVLDEGTASEEKIIVGSRSGDNLTGVVRGLDNTTAKTHTNPTIKHCSFAQDFIEANAVAAALTTKGDIFVKGNTSSVAPARLAVGTVNGQVLTVDSAQSLGLKYTTLGVVPVYTSTGARDTAIPSPSAGQAVYLDLGTSAEGLYFYNGTSWRVSSWAEPWGLLASPSSTSDQTGISALADITFATATWTAVSGRLYEIVLSVKTLQVTSTGSQAMQIQTGASGSGTVLATQDSISVPAGNTGSPNLVAYQTGSGSVSVHARIGTTAGTVTVQNGTVKGWFTVKDIGPTGNPA